MDNELVSEMVSTIDDRFTTEAFSPINSGSNEVYMVQTERNGKLLLKIQSFTDDRSFRAEPVIHELMYNSGISTPELLGSCYSTEPISRPYILMEYIDGNTPSITSENVRDILFEIGGLMRDILNVNMNFNSYGPIQVNRNQEISVQNNETWSEHIKRTGVEMLDDIHPEFTTFESDIKEYFENLGILELSFPGIFHGDVRFDNLVRQEGELFILDWGRTFYGDGLYMLARTEHFMERDELVERAYMPKKELFNGFGVSTDIRDTSEFKAYKLHTTVVELRWLSNWYSKEALQFRKKYLRRFLDVLLSD